MDINDLMDATQHEDALGMLGELFCEMINSVSERASGGVGMISALKTTWADDTSAMKIDS